MHRTNGETTAAIIFRLQCRRTCFQVMEEFGLGPVEYMSALGDAALGSDDPAEWPPLFRGLPRHFLAGPALKEAAWADAFPDSTRPRRLAMAAALLQVHDFWDESHEAAQQAGDLGERDFSAYWHAIAHRREPNPPNAAYWFRQVGPHPLFDRLVSESRSLLREPGDPRRIAPVIADATWDPFRFIELCTGASRGTKAAALALRLQRLELRTLFDATLQALAAS